MDYVSPVNEVEQQLKEAGEQLSLPPSSTKDLLDLLDKIEQLLTFVGQAPSISMQGALVPSMGALIADELIRHSDVDVRVSVASCLCEVARITAPEPPYKDEIMKEIFLLNVKAFEELSNVTGRSYYKAVHILESVAKVKSCLLMLDLECDALILEMFDQFLSIVRTSHPPSVFSDMETIMTLVIEESDEVGTELLSLLISHVRKYKQNVSPVSWELAEKVLTKCTDTLKPYSQTIMKLVSSNPDDYAEVVASLCQNACRNELVLATPAMADRIQETGDNTLENGGSTKTLVHSQPKKQNTQAALKKIDRKPDSISPKLRDGYHKTRLKEKELEASRKLSSIHESSPTKGQLKDQKNNFDQDTTPNLVQGLKGNLQKAKGLPLKNSKAIKGPKGKPEKGSTEIKGIITKGNTTSDSLYNVVVKQEDEDLKDACNLKRYGKELVGQKIKVWWPIDQTYYEGAVVSYNPSEKKHRVLYADGEEEILDLCQEQWKILEDLRPKHVMNASKSRKVQSRNSRIPLPASYRGCQKQMAKRKTDPSLRQEDNSSSPKSLSKTEHIKGADGSTTGTLCNVEIHDNPAQMLDIRGLKSMETLASEANPSGEVEERETKSGKKRPRLVKAKS